MCHWCFYSYLSKHTWKLRFFLSKYVISHGLYPPHKRTRMFCSPPLLQASWLLYLDCHQLLCIMSQYWFRVNSIYSCYLSVILFLIVHNFYLDFFNFAVGKIGVSLLGKVIRLILFLLLNTDPSLAEYRKLCSVSFLLYTFSDTAALFSRIKHCIWESPHFHFFFLSKKKNELHSWFALGSILYCNLGMSFTFIYLTFRVAVP